MLGRTSKKAFFATRHKRVKLPSKCYLINKKRTILLKKISHPISSYHGFCDETFTRSPVEFFYGRFDLKEFCVFTEVENKTSAETASFGARAAIRKHQLFAQNLTLGNATAEIMKTNGNIGCLLC